MSFVIGLTGPTGAGKSSVTDVANKLGFKIVDCDTLARVAVQKGSDGLSDVVKVFGDDVLNSDGTLNRAALAKKAFSSADNTELLNKTLLPHITALVQKEIDEELVMLDAPTLFESRLDNICDFIISVISDESIRKSRIMARDNMSEYDANMRLAAAKSDEFFISRSTHIIFNNGTKKEFEIEANNVILNIINNKGE